MKVAESNIISTADFPSSSKTYVSLVVLMQIVTQYKTATFMDFLQSVKMTDKHWEH